MVDPVNVVGRYDEQIDQFVIPRLAGLDFHTR